ncbi:hypothetical protein FM125_04155 [Micrococcus lylae]|uniref:Uncharacterized protein n=1 Tax=Micrococcus lylae TaxID=1273 RepID=A0A1R4IRH8_9MICC|nr:hypothetical protein [Micrococcus lylae]SJN22500.1 hypothetical protein FM125_04155 [Micrococcus lylae]
MRRKTTVLATAAALVVSTVLGAPVAHAAPTESPATLAPSTWLNDQWCFVFGKLYKTC